MLISMLPAPSLHALAPRSRSLSLLSRYSLPVGGGQLSHLLRARPPWVFRPSRWHSSPAGSTASSESSRHPDPAASRHPAKEPARNTVNARFGDLNLKDFLKPSGSSAVARATVSDVDVSPSLAQLLQPAEVNTLAQPRKVHIETYGCQMNSSDSEVVMAIMQRAGRFSPTPFLSSNAVSIRLRQHPRS